MRWACCTETLVAWTSARKAFTPALSAALDGNDDTALVQALLDLIELPTLVLRQHCPDQQIQVKPRGRREAGAPAVTPDLQPISQPRQDKPSGRRKAGVAATSPGARFNSHPASPRASHHRRQAAGQGNGPRL